MFEENTSREPIQKLRRRDGSRLRADKGNEFPIHANLFKLRTAEL